MSLQSSTSIGKWKFTKMAMKTAYFAAFFALFLTFSRAYSQAATHTGLSINHDGSATKLTATIKGQLGSPVSGGTVSFMSGNKSLGSAFVDADGNASISLDAVPATKQITAVYSGSESDAASFSVGALADQPNTGIPDFSVTLSSSSLNVTAGDYVSTILTVAPINCPASNPNCFTQSVALSISGLPNSVTATFTPLSVIPQTGPVNSTLQLQTHSASGGKQASNGSASHLTYALAFPGVLALAGLGVLRKRSGLLRLLGIVVLFAASVSGLTACSQRYGYLHHPPGVSPGTPAGSYTLTITAYSNNGGEVTTHSVPVTLVVK